VLPNENILLARKASRKTHSELLLEEYVRGLGVDYQYEPDEQGKARHPDYLLENARGKVWLEVKEIDAPARRPTTYFSPLPPIAEKIGQARRKFREYKSDCCALVLHSCKNIYRSIQVDVVLCAMFGENFECTPFSFDRIDDVPKRFRFSGSSTLSHDRNTTISAVIILQHWHLNELWVSVQRELLDRQARGEKILPGADFQLMVDRQDESIKITHPDTIRCVVLENPHARIPCPENLFRGPFDQRWGNIGSDYTLLWIGSGLEALRLRPQPVPFTYL
jgi:hypothetical protein